MIDSSVFSILFAKASDYREKSCTLSHAVLIIYVYLNIQSFFVLWSGLMFILIYCVGRYINKSKYTCAIRCAGNWLEWLHKSWKGSVEMWKEREKNPKKGIRKSSWLLGKNWTYNHGFVDKERSRKEFQRRCHICAALTREKARKIKKNVFKKGFVFLLRCVCFLENQCTPCPLCIVIALTPEGKSGAWKWLFWSLSIWKKYEQKEMRDTIKFW